MADPLSRMFDGVRPRGTRLELLRPETQVTVSSEAGSPLLVLIVLRGDVWATPGSGVPLRLTRGEVAIVTAVPSMRLRGEGSDAELMTATYAVEGSVCDRVLGGIPPVAVVPSTSATAGLVDLLAAEMNAPRTGGDAVIDRLVDLLVVAALRDWLTSSGVPTPAWVVAQEDHLVGSALQLMHDQPSYPWTVQSMAAELGVARSSFAKRFAELMGEGPMSYLTCWRLCLAADLLRTTELTLAVVARQVGYTSPFAFSAAFQRTYGIRPGEHRRLTRR